MEAVGRDDREKIMEKTRQGVMSEKIQTELQVVRCWSDREREISYDIPYMRNLKK